MPYPCLCYLLPCIPARQQREFLHGLQSPLSEVKGGRGRDPIHPGMKVQLENCSFPNLILLFTFLMTNSWEPRVQQAEFIHNPSIMKAPSEAVSSHTATPLKAALTFGDHPLQEWRVIQPASCLRATHPSRAAGSLLERGLPRCSVAAPLRLQAARSRGRVAAALPLGLRTLLRRDRCHRPAGRGAGDVVGFRRKTHPLGTGLHIIYSQLNACRKQRSGSR